MGRSAGMVKTVTQTKYYPFNGGLDVVTPALSIDPGFALTLVNYEPWFNGGYRRIDGYERFDGRAKPSAAASFGVTISSLSGVTGVGTSTTTNPNAYQPGTGVSSGATAIVVAAVTVAGTSYLNLTNIAGTFTNGEKVYVGTTTSTGTLMTAPSSGFAPVGTGTDGFAYTNEFSAGAQNYYRQQIGAVPGTGNVLGAWQNGTNIYAWRMPTGTNTSSAQMYIASGTGWTQSGITLVQTLQINTLGTQGMPGNGSVIKGPGGTGTLYQGVVNNGVVAGYLNLTTVTGTFGSGDVLKANGTNFGTAAGTNTPFTWPAGGKYRFKNWNFFATANTYNTYGVNGQGPAFQIDQNNVVMPILMPANPLTNQPAANTPFLVEQFSNFLFLAFPGGSAQCSVQGVPYQFNGFMGAAQIGLGAEITGMKSTVGPVLALLTQHNTQVLTGSGIANFALSLASETAGGQLYSAQLLDTVYALNNLGITSLSRTQSFGNFVGATISQLIQPIISASFPNFNDAAIVRKANQARLYFNDGSCIIVYVPGLGQQNKAWSAIESGVTAQFGYANYPTPILSIWNSEDQNNAEVSYFCLSNADGFVYQDRSGTSFDGAVVTSYVRLAFNNVGTPAVRKYFRRGDLELNSPAQINLKFAADFSYSNAESSSGVSNLVASNIPLLNVFGGGGFWDSVNWNQFQWDGQVISTARALMPGTGENVSFLIFHQAITDASFILQGLVIHYDPRRLQR
jgi:hypothetical protein